MFNMTFRRSEINFNIESKKCNLKKKSTTESNASTSKTTAIDNNQEMKYATYFDFNISSKYIKPHQVCNKKFANSFIF